MISITTVSIFLVSFLCSVNADLFFNDSIELHFENVSTSQACSQQIGLLSDENPYMLFQMLDASSKLPVGLLNLEFFQLGDFDQCYDMDPFKNIYSKYCLATVPFPSQAKSYLDTRMMGNDQGAIGLHFGFCLPNACKAEDLTALTSEILKFDENYCSSKANPLELSPGAIATIFIIACFLSIVVFSTIFEMYVHYRQIKVRHQLLVAFSALTNGRKLFSTARKSDQLSCLNGIRAISMIWVVQEHVYLNSVFGPIFSMNDVLNFQQKSSNMFIIGGSVSVDTFFVIGGLVTVYTFLKSVEHGVKFNIFLYYVHRYIRLTPALAILILIHATLFPYFVISPLAYAVNDYFVTDCKNNWWSALLYIQNFAHGYNTCVPQSWYLSVDFQLFLLSPIVLLPLKKSAKLGLSIIGILIAAGIIVPFVITYHYHLSGNMVSLSGDNDAYMWIYYKQTHARFGPYVIGMLAGYLVYKIKHADYKFKLNFPTVIILWVLSVGGLVACLYAPFVTLNEPVEVWSASSLNGFLRNAWSVCVCGVVFLCIFGYGGPIDGFLSLPIFNILTKLSYCTYLVHYPLIGLRYLSAHQSIKFSNSHMMFNFWGDFAMTIGLSTILCLTFESPMLVVEKLLFKIGKK